MVCLIRVELGVAAQKTIEGCRRKVVYKQVVSLETGHGEGKEEMPVTSGRLGLADRSPPQTIPAECWGARCGQRQRQWMIGI